MGYYMLDWELGGLMKNIYIILFSTIVFLGFCSYSYAAPELMIQFDGADAATTYTAETGQTVTFVNQAEIDTAQKQYGTSSLLLDGTGDYTSVPDSDDWNFGSGDFTIDMWIRFAADEDVTLYGQENGAPSRVQLKYYQSNSRIYFAAVDTTDKAQYWGTFAVSTDTWYHVAAVRNGTSFYIFIDGTSLSLTTDTAISTNSLPDVAAAVWFGGDDLESLYHNGWIDNVRVTKGTALWTADFTPPSPNTYFHAKCNDDAANTTVTDDGTGGNTGTSSTNTSNLSVVGQIGDGFEFSSVSSECITIDALEADVEADTIGTLTFWYKSDATDASTNVIFSFGDTNGDQYTNFYRYTDDFYISFQANGSTDRVYWIVTNQVTTSWQHWAFVQDGSALVVYLDNSVVTPSPVTSGTGTAAKWFGFAASTIDNGRIGCTNNNSGGNTNFADGVLDDLRYYKNIALTAQQINDIYQGGTGTEDDPAPYYSTGRRRIITAQ